MRTILSARSLAVLAAAGAIAASCACGAAPAPLVVRERVEAERLPAIDLQLLIQPEHQRAQLRYVRAARATLNTNGLWLGPLPRASVTLIDPPWHHEPQAVPDGAIVLDRTPWWTTATSMAPELATARALSRTFWTSLVDTSVLPPWFVDGLGEFAARRVAAALFEQENLPPGYALVEERYFDRFVPLRARVRLLPETDGAPIASYRAHPREDTSFAASGESRRSLAAKTVLALGTLERWVGRPVFDQLMTAFVQESRGRRPTVADFASVASDVSGQDLRWLFDEAFGSSRVFDYGIERLTSEPAAEGRFDTTVVARRYGDAQFTGSSGAPVGGFEKGRGVALRVTFAGGDQRVDYWDGRASEKIFRYQSADRAVSASVDPDRTLLLDVARRNNSRTLGPVRGGMATRWASRYMIWLQDLLLTAASLV